jgi:hypothetical protein
MSLLKKDRSGNVVLQRNRYVDVRNRRRSVDHDTLHKENETAVVHKGKGFDDLEKNINRVGGIPTRDHATSQHQSYQAPFHQETTNYKATPKVLVAERAVLRSVSMPMKKMNNLKFEL